MALNDALTELIAADLRQSYWLKVGEPRGDWRTASPASRDAWRLVARRADLLINNHPDPVSTREDQS